MAKVNFSVGIETALLPELVEALNAQGGYQQTLPDGTQNPVTPAQNARQVLAGILWKIIVERRIQKSIDTTQRVDRQDIN